MRDDNVPSFSIITNDGQTQRTKIIVQPTFAPFVPFVFKLFGFGLKTHAEI